MKEQRNPILLVVQSRIRQLLAQYDESASITHAATQGSLREGYLMNFLVDVLPASLRASGGFVTDGRGRTITPQVDLLVYDPTILPAAVLDERVVVLPIEVVLMAAEVKSTLNTATMDQIRKQQESLRKLRYSWTASERKYLLTTNCAGIPHFVFAYDSTISSDSVKSWFDDESHLNGVCVVGKWLLFRNPRGEPPIQFVQGDEERAEILQLLPLMLASLEASKRELQGIEREVAPGVHESFSTDLGAYLTFDVPEIE
jgi:hypothetical protein